MDRSTTTNSLVHLVGSIPLQNNRQVFELCSGCLGDRLRRLPDGETGDRSNWIRWQYPVLAQLPELEEIKLPPDRYGMVATRLKLRDGASASRIKLGSLGYSDAALASYAEFSQLKKQQVIPAQCRFQVSLPTPLAPMQFYVAAEHRALIEPIYEARLLAELNEIAQAIPASQLAIQWDTAAEFGILEGVFPSWFEDEQAEITKRLIRLGNAVPDDVQLGYHLCYGDSGQKHFTEPADTTHLTAIANGIAAGVDRTLNWIHLPVPKDRIDREYYQPLKHLELQPETEIYLGLIHDGDGADTNKQRIDAARSVLQNFGLATECGFGRRPPESVPKLIETHAQLAAANEQG